ncbi:MAG TPA: WbqC family protein [Oculatellaceae cyanobacterium]
MIVSVHQPAYLPWLGYFDKIIRSDVFVYLDTVQFEKNSFINRNRIKTVQGVAWLTVPVKIKGHFDKTLQEIEIDNTQDWKKKHLRSIYFNYKKAPRFEVCYPKLEALYAKDYLLLSELCWEHLRFWLRELKINTTLVRASELPVSGKGSDLILSLCQHLGAKTYISGCLGRNYLQQKDFHDAGIAVEYQDYRCFPYPQLWGGFLSHLCIVDFWMNSDEYWRIANQSNERLFSGVGAALSG